MADSSPRRLQQYYTTHPEMVSSVFGKTDGFDSELFLEVLDRCGVELQGRVLDVGCGEGLMAGICKERGCSYVGIDILLEQLHRTDGAHYARGEGTRLPFADGVFDVATCIDSFEHFPSQAEACRELLRVLRPGGRLFLSVPNYSNVAGMVKWWMEKTGRYEKDTWAPFGEWLPQEHESMITPGRVRRWLRDAGFTDIYFTGHGRETHLGVLPWIARGNWPEQISLRLADWALRFDKQLGRWLPRLSLHTFWSATRKE
jgi:ubiquinone/menaquinone biosynthesis C-methylase UbiE